MTTSPTLSASATDIAQSLQNAVRHHQAGQLSQAEAIYHQILQADPNHPDVLHLLGLVSHQSGNPELAIELIRKTLALRPNFAEAYNNLGAALRDHGELAEAVICYQKALALKPDYAIAHNNLGTALKHQNRLNEALACYRQAVSLRPNYAEAHYNLGVAHQEQGGLAEAVASYQKAIFFRHDYVEAHNNLGVALKRQGNPPKAIGHFRQATMLAPNFAEAHHNLGLALQDQGCLADAAASYQQAIAAYPHHVEAHYNLGNVLHGLGQPTEAIAHYQTSISLKPDFAEAHYNLGVTLMEQGELTLAAASYQKALSLKPDYVDALNNLGVTLKQQGKLDEAAVCYRKVLSLVPDDIEARSNLILCQSFDPLCSSSAYLADVKRYGDAVAKNIPSYNSWKIDHRPPRLRVGIVSGDLRAHPIGYYLEGVLPNINLDLIELVAYSNHYLFDSLSERIRPFFSDWKQIDQLDDEAVAKMIHEDGIHLLADLSGHTGHNRLPVFSRKPAPVQFSWLGCGGTTGVQQMDYYLGDPYHTPPESQLYFSETVWRMPEIFCCFTPPQMELGVSPLPALTNGYPTFGCFNSITKVNDHVVALWAQILRALPDAKLLLKTMQLEDPAIRQETLKRFAEHGIGPNQIELEGPAPRQEFLAAYQRVDISLDPFPYNGATTSAEGLWMGVPIIVRRGERPMSRIGESFAHNIGLSEWVAHDDETYIAKAVDFASDLERLAKLRASLRQKVLTSPLFDASRFARNFENALWGMWRHRKELHS